MEYKLDLHVHSASSPDGRMSVEEIVSAARKQGLSGVAVCDHDVLYRPEADAAGADLPEDFLLIPGVEFSTAYGHLLGLFLTKPVEESDLFDLIDAIHAQGGLAVLAHPFERTVDEARLEPILPLLDGVEVWNGRANRKHPDANDRAARFAAKHRLPRFAGSDAHLPREIGNGYVRLSLDALRLETVKSALLEQDNPVSGKNAKHIDTARSQHTRLSKQGAGIKRRLKWLAFAVKCLAEDAAGR